MVDQQVAEARFESQQGSTSVFALAPLPYGYQDLKPILSEETLQVHHDKHHARYVDTLNRLIGEKTITAGSLEEIIGAAWANGAKGLFNNAAQTWNHSFFWESMCPKAARPSGLLVGAISSAFGGVDGFTQQLIAEGTRHFGSGWVWLVARGATLEIVSTHDAGTPILEDGVTPLLTCDVWEHAYYIDYRQNRADWLAMWCDRLANWQFASKQYGAALGHGEPWRHPSPTQTKSEHLV